MAQPILTFYEDRDNSVLLKTYQNGYESSYASFTKVALVWRGGSVNSVDNPTLFTINNTGIRLRLGGLSLTPPAEVSALLVIYSEGWPNGIVWGERITIKFLPGA